MATRRHGRACKCIQCNMRRLGMKPGQRRRIKRVKNPPVTVFRNPRDRIASGDGSQWRYLKTYRGVPVYYHLGLYRVYMVSPTSGRLMVGRVDKESGIKRIIGSGLKRGYIADTSATNPGDASTYVAEEMRAMKRGSASVRTPAQAVAVGLSRARAAGVRVRVKPNPAASRVAFVLSRRVVDLSYLHAEDKRTPYRHKFSTGVTCQLLSDGSVRLFRPDGRPIWKNFKD